MIDPRIQTLFPALQGVAPDLLSRIEREAPPVRIPDATRIFDEGSPCRGFPLVLAGVIRVAKGTPAGRELLLYRVAPGESCVLTSSCLLGRTDYSATGHAEGEVEVTALPQPLFTALMDRHAPFREFVFGLFSERIIELMMLVEQVAFSRLDRRLASLLLDRGPQIEATQQSLADDLGSVREIVGRVLRGFADQGLVALGRAHIDIVDAGRLRGIAGS